MTCRATRRRPTGWRATVLAAVLLTAWLQAGAGRAEAVAGSGRIVLAECEGEDASVTGSGNLVVFHGTCPMLLVAGSSNLVEVDLLPGGTIEITGAANHVLYAPVEPRPVIYQQGGSNTVEAGTNGAASAALAPALPDLPPPAPDLVLAMHLPAGAPAGAIVLDGDGQDIEVSCAARDVLIHGSGGHFRLRGGCRSVTVQGRDDRIEAELAAGGRIAIGGDAVTLVYTLVGDGAPAVVSVSGARSQATPGTASPGR